MPAPFTDPEGAAQRARELHAEALDALAKVEALTAGMDAIGYARACGLLRGRMQAIALGLDSIHHALTGDYVEPGAERKEAA